MRTLWTFIAFGMISSLWFPSGAVSDSRTTEENLFPKGISGWTRDGGGKSPWHAHSDGSLTCDPANDFIVREEIFGDGVLNIEYRFIGDSKAIPKASFGIRQGPGGTSGHRISLGEGAGSITSSFIASSDFEKKVTTKADENAKLKPFGEWNQIQIVCEGKLITVKLNGVVAATNSTSDLEKGLFTLFAEGTAFEIRKATWKPAPE